MTTTAEKLVTMLRSDDRRIVFDMSQWGIRSPTCGTAACIAGHVVYSEAPHKFFDIVDRGYATSLIPDMAEQMLNLRKVHSTHLFRPDMWHSDLVDNKFVTMHGPIWTDNWRCDLDTVEKMKQWALDNFGTGGEQAFLTPDNIRCIYAEITPAIAANAVEQLCIEKQPYLDWQRAFEEA